MGRQVRNLIVTTAVVAATGFFGWYIFVHRPSADVAGNETAERFEEPAELKGTDENPAELEDVIVGEEGIQLAPAE